MLVQCTQRERGGEGNGGSALGKARRRTPQRCVLNKAKQGKYLSEFMQLPFIQWNLLRLCPDREKQHLAVEQWSYQLLPLCSLDIISVHFTQLNCSQKKHLISITIMLYGGVS